jgi:hypothetical protein
VRGKVPGSGRELVGQSGWHPLGDGRQWHSACGPSRRPVQSPGPAAHRQERRGVGKANPRPWTSRPLSVAPSICSLAGGPKTRADRAYARTVANLLPGGRHEDRNGNSDRMRAGGNDTRGGRARAARVRRRGAAEYQSGHEREWWSSVRATPSGQRGASSRTGGRNGGAACDGCRTR